MIKRVWAYMATVMFITHAIFSRPSPLRIPSDYPSLDDALHYVLTHDGSFTILLDTEGPHTLTHSSYQSTKESYVSIKAPALPYAGRYYGHHVGTFQPGDRLTGQGPYALKVKGTTIAVEPTSLVVLGKGTYKGRAPNFSKVVPGVDKLLVYNRTGATTEHMIIQAEGNTLTLKEPVTFGEGDGFTIKPRASIVLAPDHEAVTFAIKGSLSFRGIALDLTSQVPHVIFEEVTRLENCLSRWHCGASEIAASQVVHLGKKAGLEITHTYEGESQTFLGAGLTAYANKYAQSSHSCFIGSERAIDAGTYGHIVEKEAEFYECTTGVWADGGSQVAVPGSWLRRCTRGVRLSANSSCMNSDSLTMSQGELGVRALFNSQFHATSLYLDNVAVHAHIDDQHIAELMPPIQPGIRTLDPDGYGTYHSGVSYNYLTSTTFSDENVLRAHEQQSVEVKEIADSPFRTGETFLDAIPSEPLVRPYRTKKLELPKQVRKGKKKRETTENRCSRNCGKAPCDPCCIKKAKCRDELCDLERALKICKSKKTKCEDEKKGTNKRQKERAFGSKTKNTQKKFRRL